MPAGRGCPPRVELGLRCFDSNCTAWPVVCVQGSFRGRREVGGGLRQGAAPPASPVLGPLQHRHRPPHVPGTQDTSHNISQSHDIPQEVQGSMGEYIVTTSVQGERPHC